MGLQDSICAGLEQLDGEGRFQEESWVRPEGGGGRSRVLRDGTLFEQGGINFWFRARRPLTDEPEIHADQFVSYIVYFVTVLLTL